MRKKSVKKIFHAINKTIIIFTGSFLFAAAVNLFFLPADLNTGGLTGLAIILNQLFNTPIGITAFVMNIPLIIMAFRHIGPHFLAWTLTATAAVSVLIELTVNLPQMVNIGNGDDRLLFCIFGGTIAGLGLGMIFTQGATTGGTDIISRLLSLVFPHITIGKLVLITDVIIVSASAAVTGELETALYSFIALFISSYTMDMVMYGTDKSQAAIIVTKQGEKINSRIIADLDRGVTILPAKGGYSKESAEALLCAVSQRQTSKLREIVSDCDPDAFVIFTEVHDIVGSGFKSYY